MSVPSCDVCGAETFAYVDGKPVTRYPIKDAIFRQTYEAVEES